MRREETGRRKRHRHKGEGRRQVGRQVVMENGEAGGGIGGEGKKIAEGKVEGHGRMGRWRDR